MIGWYDSRVRGAINHWQFFLRTCSPKMHPVADAKISRELLKVFYLSIVIELPSHNYDLRLLLHHRCCPQVEIGSLEWVEPAYKEEYRLMERETKFFSRFLLIVCNKKLKIYSTRDNLYLVCRSPAIANQLCAFISSSGNDAISVFNQLLLHLQAQKRILARTGWPVASGERACGTSLHGEYPRVAQGEKQLLQKASNGCAARHTLY